MALLAVTALVVWHATFSNGFVWHDVPYVAANLALRDGAVKDYFTRVGTASNPAWADARPVFRPLRSLSYRLDFELRGPLDPATGHAHNLWLHFVNAVLLLILARMLGLGPLGSLFVALLFLVHPVQSEAVCWLICRDVLMGTTLVLTGLVFAGWRLTRGWRWVDTAVFGVLYLLACLASPQAVVLPAWVLLLAAARHTAEGRAAEKGKCPITGWSMATGWSLAAASAVVVAIVAFWTLSVLPPGSLAPAEIAAWWRVKLMAAPRCLGLLLTPVTLTPDYSDIGPGREEGGVLLVLGSVLVVTVVFLALRCRRVHAFVAAGLGMCVLGTFAGWRGEGWFFGERMLYMPMVGFAIMAGFLIQRLAESRVQAAGLAAGLVLVLAAGRTMFRAGDWANGERLLRPALEYTPDSTAVLRQLMRHYLSVRDFERASVVAEGLTNALALQGVDGVALAEPLRVKGVSLIAGGSVESGRELLQQAIKADPSYGTPFNDLGVNEVVSRRPADGIPLLRKACELMPYESAAFEQLGVVLANAGQTADAETAWRRAAAVEWFAPTAAERLADLLLGEKRFKEAGEVCLRALRHFPDDTAMGIRLEKAAAGRADEG